MEQIDIEKRLGNIDQKLDGIQQLMIDTALQQKDIDMLKEEVKDLKAEQKELKETVAILKNRPTKDKADKWNTIEKWLFAGVLSFLSGCVIYIIKNGMVGNVVD